MSLRTSGFRKECTIHCTTDSSDDWFNRLIEIVRLLLIAGTAINDRLSQSKLVVELILQFLNLIGEGILHRTIELRDVFGTVNVANTETIGQLISNRLASKFGLLHTQFALDRIGKLNQQIEFATAGSLINTVQKCHLSDESLERTIRFVHHSVERIFNDSTLGLGIEEKLLHTGSIIVCFHTHVLRIPFHNLSNPECFDVDRFRLPNIELGIDRNNGHVSLIKHAECYVMFELLSRLVNVRFESQAVIKTGFNHMIETPVLVQKDMLDCSP